MGSAITINALEVTLDLNGRSLINTSPTNQANGVFVNDQVDVTIQNGDIVGFGIGVLEDQAAVELNLQANRAPKASALSPGTFNFSPLTFHIVLAA